MSKNYVFGILIASAATFLNAGTGVMEPEGPIVSELSCKSSDGGMLDSLHFTYRSVFLIYRDGTRVEAMSHNGRAYSECGSAACIGHLNINGTIEKDDEVSSFDGYVLPFTMKNKSGKPRLRVKVNFDGDSKYDVDTRQRFDCQRHDI